MSPSPPYQVDLHVSTTPDWYSVSVGVGLAPAPFVVGGRSWLDRTTGGTTPGVPDWCVSKRLPTRELAAGAAENSHDQATPGRPGISSTVTRTHPWLPSIAVATLEQGRHSASADPSRRPEPGDDGRGGRPRGPARPRLLVGTAWWTPPLSRFPPRADRGVTLLGGTHAEEGATGGADVHRGHQGRPPTSARSDARQTRRRHGARRASSRRADRRSLAGGAQGARRARGTRGGVSFR